MPKEVKEGRKLNRFELEKLLNQYIYMPLSEIKTKVSNPETPAIEVIVAKIVAAAIQHGDEKRFGFLLDRLLGPMPKTIELGTMKPIPLAYSFEKEEPRPYIEPLAEVIDVANEKKSE